MTWSFTGCRLVQLNYKHAVRYQIHTHVEEVCYTYYYYYYYYSYLIYTDCMEGRVSSVSTMG
jgi:hypothetical protein